MREKRSFIHIFKSIDLKKHFQSFTFSAVLEFLEFLIVFDLDPVLMPHNTLSREMRSESGQHL